MKNQLKKLSNLQANGYLTLTLTPADADVPVTGEIVSETDETVTLKVNGEDKMFSKNRCQKSDDRYYF